MGVFACDCCVQTPMYMCACVHVRVCVCVVGQGGHQKHWSVGKQTFVCMTGIARTRSARSCEGAMAHEMSVPLSGNVENHWSVSTPPARG